MDEWTDDGWVDSCRCTAPCTYKPLSGSISVSVTAYSRSICVSVSVDKIFTL